MIDLTKLPDFYIGKHGIARVAEVAGKSVSLVSMWSKRGKFPLDAVSRLLEFDPTPIAAIQPLYGNPPVGEKLMVLVPLAGAPEPKMMDCLLKLYDRNEMSYERFAFNCLSITRNVLAAKFLSSQATWAWWQDGDSIVPCGDAAWFKEATDLPNMSDAFAGVNSILRALVHKKTIVSCCYVGRKLGAPPQFSGGDTVDMRARVRRGPRNELIEVAWAGFGGILTHRSVFESIIKTQGDEIRMAPNGIGKRFGYEYGFFNPLNGEVPSDDVPFCIRAGRAGHKTYVDLAIMAAHVGSRPYTYQDL